MPITLKYMREDFISSLFLRCLVKKGEDKIITFMKKHKIAQWIMTILCFFSVFQNLIITKVNAASNDTLVVESAWKRGDSTDAATNKWVINVRPFYAEMYGQTYNFLTHDKVLEINGKRVFCLEPLRLINRNYLNQYSLSTLFNIVPDVSIQKQIKWISALGYGFDNDYSDEMAWATQIRIWQEMDADLVKSIHPEIQAKIDLINNRLKVMNSSVSWNNQTIILDGYGKEYAKTLTDTNGVFQYYVQSNIKNVHTEKNGNELKIWLEDGDKDNTIIEYNAWYKFSNGEDVVYYNPNSQSVGRLSGGVSTSAKINVKVAKGSLDLTKTNNIGDLLEGAEFNLKSVTAGINYNEDIIVKNGHIKVDNLIAGEYVLTEVKSPNHYVAAEIGYPLTIIGNQITNRIVVNYIRPVGELTIQKGLEEMNDAAIVADGIRTSPSGIEFQINAAEDIYDIVNERLLYKKGEPISINSGDAGNGDKVTLNEGSVTSDNGIYSTSATGRIKLSGIPMGKYSIKEIKTISGYILNDKEYIVEFKKDNGNFEKTVYSHTKEFENKITKTEIIKSDIVTGETIEGADLSIIDKETGKIIATWISASDSQKIYGLTSGKTYILKENLAPVGYQIAEDVEFTIQPSGEIQKVEMKDKPDYKSVRVIKIDSKTKEPIKTQDVEFTLYEDKECTIPLMTVTTNEEGYATFDKLTYGFANNKEGQSGVFYIKETKAPKGYRLSKEVVEIEIDNNTESDSYIIEYQNHILPSIRTGVAEYIGIAIAIFLIAFVISCCIVAKRADDFDEDRKNKRKN